MRRVDVNTQAHAHATTKNKEEQDKGETREGNEEVEGKIQLFFFFE